MQPVIGEFAKPGLWNDRPGSTIAHGYRAWNSLGDTMRCSHFPSCDSEKVIRMVSAMTPDVATRVEISRYVEWKWR